LGEHSAVTIYTVLPILVSVFANAIITPPKHCGEAVTSPQCVY